MKGLKIIHEDGDPKANWISIQASFINTLVGCYLPNRIDVGQLNTKGTKERLLNR